MPARWPTPEEGLLAGETREVIVRAIEALPKAQRTVIALRDVEGWSSEEVCEALEITAGNQRVLLHRARSTVRTAIEEYFGAVEEIDIRRRNGRADGRHCKGELRMTADTPTLPPDDLACTEEVELMTDYLEGALPDAERRRLELHLETCPGCTEYLEQMRTVAGSLGGLTRGVDPAPRRARRCSTRSATCAAS